MAGRFFLFSMLFLVNCYRLQIVHLGKLTLPFWGEVVADQDQRQFRVGQQAFFHDVRVLLVEGAGPLIHQEDRAVMDQRTGNGDPLLLSAGEVAALLTHY